MITVLDAVLVNGYGAKLAAGWTKPYAGTNVAMYRQGTGNQLYMRVDDTSTLSANVYGCETSNGINSFTNRFPNAAASTSGLFFNKSNAADTTARAWMIIATSKALYMWVNINNEAGSALVNSGLVFFGDIQPTKANDIYHTMIIGHYAAGSTGSQFPFLATSLPVGLSSHFMARSYTQVGSSVQVSKHSDYMRGASVVGRGNITFPNPIDGSVVLAPIWVHENLLSSYPIRGVMPGVWNICHTAPFNHGDVFQGTGLLVGKTFMAVNMWWNGSTAAQVAIETSNTW
jgi:hypothetical protein